MYTLNIVTPAEVKTLVPEINYEISDTLISNAIKMVEMTVLQESIGQEWTDEIMSQKSGGTYTTSNKYIVENFLKNILAYSVWQYLTTTLSLQLNSSGLRIKQSDHSIASESKDIAYYRDFIENYLDRVRKLMKRYIDDHKSDYPLYYNNIYHDKPSKNVFNFKISSV